MDILNKYLGERILKPVRKGMIKKTDIKSVLSGLSNGTINVNDAEKYINDIINRKVDSSYREGVHDGKNNDDGGCRY